LVSDERRRNEMMHLEAWVYKRDGTAKVEHTERDDEQGRTAMDNWVFDRLLHFDVERIQVGHARRIAGTGGKGTYR
jgi:hypothetical protein